MAKASDETIDVGDAINPARVAAKLVVVAGPDEGLEVPLNASVEIGTDATCTMAMHDPSVSRKHVAVRSSGGRIEVKDLGSRNGTLLGGARLVEAEVPLGAVLTLEEAGPNRTHAALDVEGAWLRVNRALPRKALGRLYALVQTAGTI